MNKIGKQFVTHEMIAAKAEVHSSTVSLALRNDRRLPESTRRRVQAVAEKLGYSPDPLVSLLMARVRRRDGNYHGTLAFVHTAPAGSPRLNYQVNRNFLAGAKRRAAQLGYNLDQFFLDPEEMNGERLVAVLRARNIAGMVIEHTRGPSCPERRLPFDIAPFAAATVGTPLSYPQLNYAANDQYMRPVLAARELLALGYRRLGLVLENDYDAAMAHRCSAGFWAVREYVPDLAAIPIFRAGAPDRRAFRAWLRRHRPDVVLGTHLSTLESLREAGLRVPRDIGWVCIDWLPEYRPSAGVYGNSEHTGAAAVELVVSQMHRGESGPPMQAMNYLVVGTWIPGGTIRRVGAPLDADASFFADSLRA